MTSRSEILKWVNKRKKGKQDDRRRLEDELLEQITLAGLSAPEREFRFEPRRRWRTDFAWPIRRLLLEVEGGTWIVGGGRHNRGSGYESDIEKYNAAVLAGFRLLRVTGKHIKSGQALAWIEEMLKK